MAGFADLVAKGQPALLGGGCAAKATEGRTWSWTFLDIVDDNGDDIDLSGITGTCTVWDGATVVTTLTFTGGTGTFTVSKAKADTVNLAGSVRERKCKWGLELDNGTVAVQAWAPTNSSFVIFNEDGVA